MSLQSCPTLCDPIDGSPPRSPVPGILQARTLEWVAISFSNARKWKLKVKSLSRVWLLATPWTAAYQASPSMGFSRQKSTGVGFPVTEARVTPGPSHSHRGCYSFNSDCDKPRACYDDSYFCLFMCLLFVCFHFYLFVFGCAGSSLLHRLFSSCGKCDNSSLWCASFSLWWLLLLQSMSSRAWRSQQLWRVGSVGEVPRL